ncbi:MAG TPA: DUF6531 domain-containing protein, partial [Thermoanaerobaculia bacterium]|nr:DUF6531 domain-containing protein [Thermoanaerobaculia bacterium]
VLNRGTIGEITSNRIPLQLHQPIFDEVDTNVEISQDVDLANRRVCLEPDIFRFRTSQEAHVTLIFRKVDSIAQDGSPVLGAPIRLIDDELMQADDHELPISVQDLPAGEYRFELAGVATADSGTDSVEGSAVSTQRNRNDLPLGHTQVQDVDLFDGHLSLSREDFALAGRVPLAFRRSYSSSAGGAKGPLGPGWTHNWDLNLQVSPCHEVLLQAGDGSTQRFVDDGSPSLRPSRGYHGALIRNAADSTFDFYSKDGTRYHFKPVGSQGWLLDFAEDTNGNRTDLVYGPSRNGEALLLRVRDHGSGRSLSFSYEWRQFVLWEGAVIVEVEGPEGMAVTFDYDRFGNLASAAREPQPGGAASRSESYTYQWGGDDPLDTRHLLIAATNDLDGSSTGYTYDRGSICVPTPDASVAVPSHIVTSVRKPEGGTFGFEYALAGLASCSTTELLQKVTDPGSHTTEYHLDRYGTAVEIVDPLGGATHQTWDLDHVVLTSRTDANGHSTSYEYDEWGNLTRESITATDAGGAQRTPERRTSYWPPETFAPPYVKDRPHVRTDRDGHETTLEYDAHGNLTETSITVGQVDGPSTTHRIQHTYYANGDLATTIDARGTVASFAYDAYGHPATVSDPEGDTVTHWNARSLPVERIDKEGRSTRFEHDALGRLTTKTLPEVAGDSGPVEERTIYDDAARTRTEVDPLGRQTVTTLDREGRVVRIDNAAGGVKVYGYDLAGNKTLESRWFDGTTPRADATFTYDAANRLSERLEPLGRKTTYDYDPAGNVLRETLSDAANPSFAPRIVEHDYDELDRPIRERRLLAVEGGGSTPVVEVAGYDGEGHRTLERDALGRETTHRFDALGRKIETSEPEWDGDRHPGERKVTQWLYDGNGNVTREVRKNRPADQVREFAYDSLDRLTRRKDAGTGGWTEFEYDRVGNLVRETSPLLDVTSYLYDARDQRRTRTQHLDRVSDLGLVTYGYDYDLAGNVTGEQQPNGNDLVHGYGALNRLLVTTDDLGAVVAYTYDAAGNR